MTTQGHYVPSPSDRVKKQVALYEATDGAEGGTLNGKPVIVLTTHRWRKIREHPQNAADADRAPASASF